MSYFESLGRKITQTGQGAVQKTKDGVEIARQNSIISEMERTIAKCYTEIGRIYFEQNGGDTSIPVFRAPFQKIGEAMNKIEEAKAHIRFLKGVTLCPNCGEEIATGVVYCAHCGARTMPEMPKNENVCPSCGQPVSEDQLFCVYCGTRIEKKEPFEPKILKCSVCGTEYNEGDAFCINCGHALAENNKNTVAEDGEQAFEI